MTNIEALELLFLAAVWGLAMGGFFGMIYTGVDKR